MGCKTLVQSLKGALFVGVLYLLFYCWRLIFMELGSILSLLLLHSILATMLLLCRHVHYKRHGAVVVHGNIISTAANNYNNLQEENPTGSSRFALERFLFCDKLYPYVLVEYEATQVRSVHSRNKAKQQTVYQTVKVQKWLPGLYQSLVSRTMPVLVLPGKPISAVPQHQSNWIRLIMLPILLAVTAAIGLQGIGIPLWFFGYSTFLDDDDSTCEGSKNDESVVRCQTSCNNLNTQVIYVFTAVVATLLVLIRSSGAAAVQPPRIVMGQQEVESIVNEDNNSLEHATVGKSDIEMKGSNLGTTPAASIGLAL